MTVDNIRWLRENGPLVVRRDHLAELSPLEWAVRAGRLNAVLPGVYLVAGVIGDVRWRMAAAAAWRPDAVICGAAAARLGFWPELPVAVIEVAARTRIFRSGFVFSRRTVPDDHILHFGGLRLASPALAALDLVATLGGDPIDRLLRSRRATLADLWDAFRATPFRPGNTDRRRLLLDSRDEPWSAAERLAHRLLRAAGITGWRANVAVMVGDARYFIDIAFPGLKLAIEIDGRLHEDDSRIFENDRYRQNDLASQGWTVLRFTWEMLTRDPEYVIGRIKQAMRRCATSER